ncbi:MAG: cation:proton antiporter [Oscillospiraceae bacterium]
MELSTLLSLAVLLLCGLLFSKLIRILKLPDVTGYLVGGLIIGPSLLGLLSIGNVQSLSMISDVALGFIAFSIGSEFKISYFKRVGFTPIVIAIFESLVAVLFVTLGLVAVGQELPFAIVLGAIAAATAPAATIMVIKQYKAKGPVSETLLSVVALDDAVALMAFGIAVAVAKSMVGGDASILASIMTPLWEILQSLGAGALLGVAFTFLLRFFKSSSNRLCLAIAFVLLTTAVADILGVSALLMTMAMGAVFTNMCKNSSEIMNVCDKITPPIFMMFFVLSGAGLDLAILPSIGLIGVVYIVLRVIGKITGASLGAKLMKAPDNVCKYLGPALIPQAGVAIGLTFVAASVVPQYAEVIRAVILCGTLIYELIGPGITKLSLMKAGEIEKGA